MAEMAHDVHWHHGDGNTRNGRGKVTWINGSSRKMYPRIQTVSELIPSVLKNFDNVVKEYTYLAGNILISIVCSKLYPDKFVPINDSFKEWADEFFEVNPSGGRDVGGVLGAASILQGCSRSA